MGSPSALGFTERILNHWLRAACLAFEHSVALEMMGIANSDAREGRRGYVRPPQSTAESLTICHTSCHTERSDVGDGRLSS